MYKNLCELVVNISSYIETAFPWLFLVLCFTMPFAKAVAGPVYVTCFVLFAIQAFFRKEFQTEAKKYYLAVLFYLSIIAISLTYTPDFLEGLGILKQQCMVILGVILIERIQTAKAARRYLYAFAAGGTILALIGAYQGLISNISRPPTLWYPVHGGNLLLISSVVLIALLISETSLVLKSANAIALSIHGLALYLNGTRGTWIALAVVLLLVPFIHGRTSLKRKIIYLLSLLVIAIVACSGNFFHKKIREAKDDLVAYNDSSNSVTSLGGRFEMWKVSGRMFLEHPLLGIGIGGWEKEYKNTMVQRKAPAYLMQFNQTHNIYLDALSTRGLIGIFSLFLLIVCPAYYALKSKETEGVLFRNVLILVAIAFLVSGLTDTLVRIRFVFMSYILVTGLGLAALVRLPMNKDLRGDVKV